MTFKLPPPRNGTTIYKKQGFGFCLVFGFVVLLVLGFAYKILKVAWVCPEVFVSSSRVRSWPLLLGLN